MKRQSGHLLLLSALVVALLAQPSGGAHQPDTAATAAAVAGADALHAADSSSSSLTPPVWPEQFKSVMFQNRTNRLALVTLYYDWKLGANLNIISSQLGSAGTVWDLEWNNGEGTHRGTHTRTAPSRWCGWLASLPQRIEVGFLAPWVLAGTSAQIMPVAQGSLGGKQLFLLAISIYHCCPGCMCACARM